VYEKKYGDFMKNNVKRLWIVRGLLALVIMLALMLGLTIEILRSERLKFDQEQGRMLETR